MNNRKSSLGFALLAISLFYFASAVIAQTPQQIAQKAFRSTVLLVMEDAKGQPLSFGSGFFVGHQQIATNLHVVEGAARGYAKLVSTETKFNIEGYTAIDTQRDLIILRVAAHGTQAMSLGNSNFTQVGEAVYAVGNPRGLEGTFSEGIISSIRPVGNDKLIQITAPLSPGSSGGPVLNRRGQVIGVSVFTIRDGQNLNFAIPSNYLKTLLTKVGYTRSLSQAKPAKGQRSLMGNSGNSSRTGVTGDKFAWTEDHLHGGKKFSFSMRNRLREDVKNVHYYVIFYDALGDPIDVIETWFDSPIPAGLAKRVRNRNPNPYRKIDTEFLIYAYHAFSVQDDVYELTEHLEIRVLDYEIVR